MEHTDRFKRLVHYVCSRCADEPEKLGAVKLNKALWMSDFLWYYRTGEPITRARYVKRQFGPVPSGIVPTLRELEQAGVLRTVTTEYYGREKKEFPVRVRETGEFLSREERELVDKIIDFVTEQHSAASISNWSHDHVWRAASDGEEIPYYTVFANPGQVTSEDLEWANLKLNAEL